MRVKVEEPTKRGGYVPMQGDCVYSPLGFLVGSSVLCSFVHLAPSVLE